MGIFTRFLVIDCPEALHCAPNGRNPAFKVRFTADGEIPFPQVILHGQGLQTLLRGSAIRSRRVASREWHYVASVPSGTIEGGRISIQIEGCRAADLSQASGEDWIKAYRELRLITPPRPQAEIRIALAGGAEVKLYFGIHKHMHQPYYNTTDRNYWDGEKEDIFGSRGGNYTDFIP
ncbi:MAG: glycosyl hydrolase family 57, partial [Methylococcaceae bacterium]|nr:glycosyl hydrolase family 57 [Methylococcaceae bacterium]